MKAGDFIRVRGKKPDWLDREKGRTYPDYNALIVEMRDDDRSLFYCTIMKADGSLWNVYEKNIIGAAV